MSSIYFNPDFLAFFKELSGNNHKEWFDINRKRYEMEVKEPFHRFVGDIIETLRDTTDPDLLIEPKDAIFRINRDVRFSKDKSLYKTCVSALITPQGRKGMSHPGLYIELGPEHLGIYGGLYMLDKEQLEMVRYYIVDHMERYQKLIADTNFIAHYGQIQGEEQKRLNSPFKEASEQIPHLYKKQYYYSKHLKPEQILQDDLLECVIDYYEAAEGLRTFFREALEQ